MIDDLPIRSPADERRLSRAIGVLLDKGLRGSDVAWALLRLAVDVDRRAPRVSPHGYRNSMPAVAHSWEELSDAYAQRLVDIAEGSKFECAPSGPELDLLAAIDNVFRGALRDHALLMQDAGKVTRGPNADFRMAVGPRIRQTAAEGCSRTGNLAAEGRRPQEAQTANDLACHSAADDCKTGTRRLQATDLRSPAGRRLHEF